ncbi:Fic family protein [Fibrobacter succinogenes]|uniref:Fic family protein n=1 Tax=Fibrobacter succinogenes TaxID=833 RepID=UPI0013D2E470|nr:DUF4172 domain-containing protein [Fibrobacter succinogenes]
MIVSKPLFIHQYPDWTKFRYNAQSVMDALGQTRLLEGALVGVADLVCDSDTETRMLAKDIAANYALDGYTLEIPKLESEIQKKNSARNDIRNFVGAIQNAKLPLTEERLFAWHAAIGQNKVKSFRTKESFAGTFTGVSPERIPLEIGRFIDWFENSTQDGAIKAAIAHFWFLTIRPFEDGNGRIARALSAMLLARSEDTTRCQYALNEQILKDRENYIQTLFKAQAGNGDLTEWILWFLNAMQKSIDDSKKEIAGALKKMQFLQKNQQADLSGRERRIIEAVWNGELPAIFSVKEVATFTGTSHDSALRDIQDLIQKEIVRPENKGGRSQKYSLI